MRDPISIVVALMLVAGLALNSVVRWPERVEPLVTSGVLVLVGTVLWASYLAPEKASLFRFIRRIAETTVYPFKPWVLLPLGGLFYFFAAVAVLFSFE